MASRRATPDGAARSGQVPRGWWRDYFDGWYLAEFSPRFDARSARGEVAALTERLGLPVGARLLDLGCGQGRHAELLAEAGFDVVGADWSRPLLAIARRRAAGLPRLRYVRADMRALPRAWAGRFDAVLNLGTSFGFFEDPEDDLRVLREVRRVLRPDGRFAWQGGNLAGISRRFLRGESWTAPGGVQVTQRRRLDRRTGLLTVSTTWSRDDRVVTERMHRIRLRTVAGLCAMLSRAGLCAAGRWGGFGEARFRADVHEMLVLASSC